MMRVLWLNEGFNPGREREAAHTLVDQGVDVLGSTFQDSASIVQHVEIKRHNDELSGNRYRLRLFIGLPSARHERVLVNFQPSCEHAEEAFLRINPFGQLPVLDDNGFVLRNAQAILVCVATPHNLDQRRFPAGAQARAQFVHWWSVAGDITRSASATRLHGAFGI